VKQRDSVQRFARLRTVSANVALVLAAVALVAGLAEAASRLMDGLAPPQPRSWVEHRLRLPPPYQNAPYDVAELVAEGRALKWQTGPDFGWLPEDRAGRYINISQHRRATPGGSDNGARRLWLFGGSTVMGAEVPDGLTLASLVQRFIDSSNLGPMKVENLGATTITTQHQLFRLRNMTPVQAGDVVVFYDGVNDVIQSLYYKNPHGTMVEANRQALSGLPAIQRLLWRTYAKFADQSAFIRRFLNPTKPVDRNLDISNEMIAELEDHYHSIVKNAAEFARARSATFFHFIQPTIYTVGHHTPYERSLLENGWLYPTNLVDAYAVGYPALRRASRRAVEDGIASTDLSGALEQREREIFLDFCHVNEHGNELIARAIFNALQASAGRHG
jgi:hypothetical protein